MKPVGVIAVGVVCAILGAGVGAMNSKPASTPSPTVTVTAKPEAQTISKTPDSCLKALDLSEQINSIFSEFAESMVDYPQLVIDAARAGFEQNASGLHTVTNKVDAISEKTQDFTSRLKSITPDYKAAVADCRANG